EDISYPIGAFLDSPYNGDVSLQASSVNIAPNVIRQLEPEEETKVSREAIWLWVAIIATIGNIIVVGVVCVCAF
uniref:Uncharacterized protein n=1 Tax=Callorhinchus milii TaxID=7868 RepID=A0A4W3HMD4_CALMI